MTTAKMMITTKNKTMKKQRFLLNAYVRQGLCLCHEAVGSTMAAQPQREICNDDKTKKKIKQ